MIVDILKECTGIADGYILTNKFVFTLSLAFFCQFSSNRVKELILKSSVLVLQMDTFRQISIELWPLIDIINWFFTLCLWHFFTDFLQLLHEKV